MSGTKIKGVALFFLFFYCGYVTGATSTPSAYTSSTSIAPSVKSVQVPATPAPGSLQALSSYTQVAAIPKDPGDFVSDSKNACQSNETRDSCFVRYMVKKQNNPAAGSPQYILSNNNLQCPEGYYGVAAFDNRVIDSLQIGSSNPDTIYYFDSITFYPVSQSEYNTYSASNFSCTINFDSPVVDSGSTCIEGGCGALSPEKKVVNGYMAQKRTSVRYRQDTYNSGSNKCKHYTLAGCPSSWCSRWQWEDYKYQNLKCTRSKGFYNTNASGGALSPSLVPAINPLYTPSILICSKPNIVWH